SGPRSNPPAPFPTREGGVTQLGSPLRFGEGDGGRGWVRLPRSAVQGQCSDADVVSSSRQHHVELRLVDVVLSLARVLPFQVGHLAVEQFLLQLFWEEGGKEPRD